jgi:adenylate cyclase
VWQGRFDESFAEFKHASELDPLSAGITNDVGIPLAYQAKYDAARAQFRQALELDPGFFFARWCRAWTYLDAGRFSEAIAELEKARAMDAPPFVTAWLGYAYAKSGDRDKARVILAKLNQISSRRFVSPFCTAIIYLGLGDKKRALDGLERTYEVRSQWALLLEIDKIYDPLRAESRFIALLKKVGLDK